MFGTASRGNIVLPPPVLAPFVQNSRWQGSFASACVSSVCAETVYSSTVSPQPVFVACVLLGGKEKGEQKKTLGRSWGFLGALLGPSWGLLGPSWSHLEASEAHRKRKGEEAKNIDFL